MGWGGPSLCHTAPRYPAEDLMEWCASIWLTSRREKWCSHPTEVTSDGLCWRRHSRCLQNLVFFSDLFLHRHHCLKNKISTTLSIVLDNAPTITLKASTWRRPTVCRSSSDRRFDPGLCRHHSRCTGSCGHAWPYWRNSGLDPAGPDGLHVTHQLPPQHGQHPLHSHQSFEERELSLYSRGSFLCYS